MHKHFSCIEFTENDIVRSGLVKEFILTKARYDTTIYNMVQMHVESEIRKDQNISTH